MSNCKWKIQHKPTYHAWYNAKDRCTNPNHPAYPNYGGRGITFTSTWENFDTFVQDMGLCPTGFTLERLDNAKGYTSDNCTWATYSRQNHNKRLFRNNTTGIKGVCPGRKGFKVYAAHTHLGTTADFFEACCIRKSWENRNGIRF